VMDPGESRKFRTVRVKAGGTLTVREWDGNSGGELRLEASRVIIEEVAALSSYLLLTFFLVTGRGDRCVWERRPRRHVRGCDGAAK
jgi:hypothetical protein